MCGDPYSEFVLCIEPSKCINTEHPAGAVAAAPEEQLGVWCLAQGSHLNHGMKSESACHSLPHREFLPDLRIEPATFDLQVRLSNY